jgi:hypothetical protein
MPNKIVSPLPNDFTIELLNHICGKPVIAAFKDKMSSTK